MKKNHNFSKDSTTNTSRKSQVVMTVEFEPETAKSVMGSFYEEVELGVDAAMESGNWNGDGPFYDYVERHSLEYLQLKKSIRIFFVVNFENGTPLEMMEALNSDIETTLVSMIDSGNWNDDGPFYDAMTNYDFGTLKIS